MFVSLAARFIANIEALNAVESVGNITKHRRAPVVVYDKASKSYMIRYVPAISGEAIAHAYQFNIAEFARFIYRETLPLCKWCSRGEFFKEMPPDYMIKEAKEIISNKQLDIEIKKHEFEKAVIKACLVEDIGGFLFAGEPPVKRTSAFQVGYVIPTLDTLEATVIDTQFHARHASVIAGKEKEEREREMSTNSRQGEKRKEEMAAQMIYYVEVASAVYGLHINVDLDAIGRTRLVKIEDAVDLEERKRRILAALGGLALTVSGQFGAKRTRFNPIEEIRSILVSVSKPNIFTVTPPHSISYIKSTIDRSSSFIKAFSRFGISSNINLFAYDVETGEKIEGIQYFTNVESLFNAVIDYVMGAL